MEVGMCDAVLVFIGTKCVGAAHNAAEIDQLCRAHNTQNEDAYFVPCQERPAIRHITITIKGDWNVRDKEPL